MYITAVSDLVIYFLIFVMKKLKTYRDLWLLRSAIYIFIFILIFNITLPINLITKVSASAIRGQSGDLWADVEVGKRDFNEIIPREVVPYKVNSPGGVILDKSVSPARMYVWDSGNSRILGVNLGVCDGLTTACTPDIIIGQPSGSDYGSCNQDGSFQNYPNRAPASASTLCGMAEWTHTTLEEKSFVNMYVDASGNLYVPDYHNNRVLKYISPFTTDVVADDVWGQPDFTSNKCNLTKVYGQNTPQPTASSFCFNAVGGEGAGVTFDSTGNMWVTDGGNNRVLRFPNVSGNISKTADVVLGQTNFTTGGDFSSGTALNRMHSPAAVEFDNQGKLYVADRENRRVLVFTAPFTNGKTGVNLGATFNDGPFTVKATANRDGIWTTESANWIAYPKLWNLDGTLNKAVTGWGISGGSIDFNESGDLFISTYIYEDISKFQLQGDGTYTEAKRYFSPPNGYNLTTSRRFEHNAWGGVAVANNQLFVADGRLQFWNNPSTLTNGQTPDGYLGTGSATEIPFRLYGQIQTDLDNRIWVEKQTEIQVYQTPVVTGQLPVKVITSPINILGGGQLTFNQVHGLAPTSHGEYLWLAETDSHRVFRVKDPLTNPVVDVILGQTTLTGNQCNRGAVPAPNTGTTQSADRTMLCFPGALSIDKLGNLYVSDHWLEANGNWRLLMFSPTLFPDNPTSVLFAPLATKEFPRKVSTIPNPYAYDHATFGVAFDSTNKMVTGYNPYRGKRFIEYYNNPTAFNAANPSDPNYAVPSGQFNDFYGWAVAMNFDSNDNLYVLDANRGRVMIYKQPMPDTLAPATSISSPTNGASVAGVVSINATATDNRSVSKVEFYIDNSLVSTQTSAPYTYSWDTSALGGNTQHALYTKAYDAANNITTSATINVTIADVVAPTTTIIFPGNNSSVTGNLSITTNTSDNVGVTNVEFYVDNNLLTTSTTSPYTAMWDTSALTQGSAHTLFTKAYDAAGNIGTSSVVNVSILDINNPTVSITSPTNNGAVTGAVNITADASDNLGISNVEFYVDGNLLSTDSASPYSANWDVSSLVQGSTHSLNAKAYDAAGNVTTSTDINVTIADITTPTASITSPVNNASVSGSVNIAANASDNINVTKVEFYVDGNLVSTDTASPYAASWNTAGLTANSAHTLLVKAYDAANNVGTSTVNVTITDTTAPTVSITSPVNGGTVARNTNVTITANASDNVGVAKVEFYINGVLRSTDTTSPYSYVWLVPAQKGLTYTLTAKAYDALNNVTTSSTATVTSK